MAARNPLRVEHKRARAIEQAKEFMENKRKHPLNESAHRIFRSPAQISAAAGGWCFERVRRLSSSTPSEKAIAK